VCYDPLGTKSIDTKSKVLDKVTPLAVFNEKFQMKTVLEYDFLRRQFIKKKSELQLWKKDMSTMLGSAEFDLSKYANEEKAVEEKLPIKNSSYSTEGYVEIYIKCKAEGGLPLTQGSAPHPSMARGGLNTSALTRMPTIEEKDSECDVKEEIEKKEKEYLKRLEQLEADVERLKHEKAVHDAQLA